jgi:hypothetical protein
LKKLTKITSIFTYPVVIFVLAVSTLASMSLISPIRVKAATLPTYRYTETFDSSSGQAQANTVATDSSGDIFQVGQFSGTVNFAGTQGTDNQTSSNFGVFLTKYSNDGTYAWTNTIPSNDYAYGSGVAVDSQGNIYVAGQFSGTVNFAGTQGTDNQTDAGGYGNSFLTKYTADGTYAWTKTFDTTSGYAEGLGVAVDTSGDIYLAGQFSGTVNFNTAGSDSQSAPTANSDGCITEFHADGSYGWTKIFGGSGIGYVGNVAVAVDSSGDAYVTGEFSGTVNFAGDQGTDNQTDAGGTGDAYLTEYSSSGTYKHTETFDTSAAGGTYANGLSVAVDPSNNIYIGGEFSGTVNFKGTQGTDNFIDTGGNGDGFLTKFDPSGNYLYTNTFITTTSSDNATTFAVTTDATGNVYVAGGFLGTINFEGSQGTDSLTDPTGTGDAYLTQYTPSGTYVWTRIFGDPSGGGGGPGDPYAIGATTDGLGNVYMTGAWDGTITFDDHGNTDTKTTTQNDAFLTSFVSFIPPTPPSGGSNPSGGGSTTKTAPKTPNTGSGLVNARVSMPLIGLSLISAGIYGVSRKIKRSDHL